MRTLALIAALLFPAASVWAAPDISTLRLNAVLVSESGRSALINRRIVQTGDRVDNAEILAIDVASVIVRSQGREYVLQIGSNAGPSLHTPVAENVSVASAERTTPRSRPVDDTARTPSIPPPGPQVHRVARGETLSGIAADYFENDPSLMNQAMLAIYDDNPLAFSGDMNVLFEGATLRIPDAQKLRRVDTSVAAAEVARHLERWKREAAPPRALASVSDHSLYGPIEKNETLSAIAARERPEGVSLDQMMMAIYDANPEAFGGHIDILYEGASLRIPAMVAPHHRARDIATAAALPHDAPWPMEERPTRLSWRDPSNQGVSMSSLHDFDAVSIQGEPIQLSQFEGQLCLVVNVASRWGLTGQYAGLRTLHDENEDLSVLAFPCNQFGGQEPGTDAEILEFATSKYGVSFPMFSKIEVNGDGASEIYRFLKAGHPDEDGNEDIAWNFTKFLVGRDGQVLQRFAPQVTPAEIAEAAAAHL